MCGPIWKRYRGLHFAGLRGHYIRTRNIRPYKYRMVLLEPKCYKSHDTGKLIDVTVGSMVKLGIVSVATNRPLWAPPLQVKPNISGATTGIFFWSASSANRQQHLGGLIGRLCCRIFSESRSSKETLYLLFLPYPQYGNIIRIHNVYYYDMQMMCKLTLSLLISLMCDNAASLYNSKYYRLSACTSLWPLWAGLLERSECSF